jgi:hypothetical protein
LPYKEDATFIMEFGKLSPNSRMPLIRHTSKLPIDDLVALCAKSDGYSYPLGYKEDGKPPNKVPKPIGTFLALMKFISHDPECWIILRNFVQQSQWKHKQLPLSEEAQTAVRSLDFLRRSIMYPVAIAAQWVSQKYIVEKFIMEFALKAKDDPHVADDLANHHGTDFPVCGKHHFKYLYDIHQKQNIIVESKLSKNVNAKLTNKLQYAAHATMLKDVLATINEIGFHPEITRTNSANHAVELYLR